MTELLGSWGPRFVVGRYKRRQKKKKSPHLLFMIRLHNPFESKNLTCFPKVFWNNSSLINSSPFKEKLRVFFLLWFVSRFLNLIFNLIYNFKGYNPIMVIRKYWLYSPCYTIYLWAYPTANSLYLPSPHSFTAPPSLDICDSFWL